MKGVQKRLCPLPCRPFAGHAAGAAHPWCTDCLPGASSGGPSTSLCWDPTAAPGRGHHSPPPRLQSYKCIFLAYRLPTQHPAHSWVMLESSRRVGEHPVPSASCQRAASAVLGHVPNTAMALTSCLPGASWAFCRETTAKRASAQHPC